MQPLKILQQRLDEARNYWSCRDEEHKTNLVRLVIQRGESECFQLVKCVESVISTLGYYMRKLTVVELLEWGARISVIASWAKKLGIWFLFLAKPQPSRGKKKLITTHNIIPKESRCNPDTPNHSENVSAKLLPSRVIFIA